MPDVAQRERSAWNAFIKHWLDCPPCWRCGDMAHEGGYCPTGKKLLTRWKATSKKRRLGKGATDG